MERLRVANGSISASPWLPFGVGQDAGIRLLCVPHAGGTAATYRAWGKGLPAGIEVCPIQLPGRGRRTPEKPLTSVGPLVAEMAPHVLEAVKPPYAFFGHSTGALCVFELARKIRALGGVEPVHLFVAGRPAPQLPIPQTNLGTLNVDEFAVVLRNLGGTPQEVLANHDFLAAMQPLITADFSVNECYDYQPEPPLRVPITALAATGDRTADPEQMAAWERQTMGGFRLGTLVGGHFAVIERAEEVHSYIAGALRPFIT